MRYKERFIFFLGIFSIAVIIFIVVANISEIILIGYKIFIEILATTINIITAIEKMPRKNINLSLYLIADNILKIFDNL